MTNPTNTDFLEIIQYLNLKAGKKFMVTEPHKRLMRARFREGATVEDFKKAIDNQLQDPYFRENPKYMRPSTLFNDKFGGYVNNNPPAIKEFAKEKAEVSKYTPEVQAKINALAKKASTAFKSGDMKAAKEYQLKIKEITG